MTRFGMRGLAAIALAVGVLAALASPAEAGHNTPLLLNGEVLTVGQRLNIAAGLNSGYRLVVQADGNVVLYRWNNKALWATWSQGNPLGFLGIQSDGNAVLRRSDLAVVWQSGTSGSNNRLALQPDGNLVVYTPANVALTSTSTNENLYDGHLPLFCGYDANRTASIRVRRPTNTGSTANNRAGETVNQGVWWWNYQTPTAAPPFEIVETVMGGVPPASEIVALSDTSIGSTTYAKADGSTTAPCPASGGTTLRINTILVDTPALYAHVGPHELGHFLGLSHWPENGSALFAPYDSWDPIANPALCAYLPIMWPFGDDGASCGRNAPVGIDISRIARIYN